jgi:hypothetical protein
MPLAQSDPLILNDRASYTGILAITRLEPHLTVEAGLSIGKVYNYYKRKEEFYLSVIQHYELHREQLRKKSLGSMKDFFDLARIAIYGTGDSGNRLRQSKRRIHGPDV